MPLTDRQKDPRVLRAALKTLSQAVATSLATLDAEMRGPSTVERGKRIARIATWLEIQNDIARHCHLGEKFPLKRPKPNDAAI